MLRLVRFTHLVMLLVLGIVGLFLGGCTGQAPVTPQSSAAVNVWLDQPAQTEGIVLPLAAYTLKAHANGGVSQITFLVNSVPLGNVTTNASLTEVSAEWHWTPSHPGEYQIQAQAMGEGISALSEIARICIAMDTNIADACAVNSTENRTSTATPGVISKAVTLTPNEEPPIEFKVEGSPDPVYFGQCTQAEAQIVHFKGFASDMSEASKAYMRVFLGDASGTIQELSTILMTPSGGNSYTAQYDLRKMDPALLGGAPGSLIISMALMDRQEIFYASSPEWTTKILSCGVPTSLPLELKVSASPDPVFLGQCTQGENQIAEFHGYANNPSEARAVMLRLSLVNSAGQHQALTDQPMTSSGNSAYITTLDMKSVDGKIMAQEKGKLVFTMNIMGANKEIFATSPEQAITAAPCVSEKAAKTQQQPLATETQSQDALPPEIKTSVSTNEVYFDPTGNRCDPNKTTSVTISAQITDPSGVKTPTLYWYYAKTGKPYGATQMVMYSDGGTWSSTIRPDHGDDIIAYWVEAYDIYGNHAQAKGENTITVSECKASQ